ncbi:MAG: PilZ domain-containing protein [Spirochaetia bacterium]|nr:PilZ domain-containing protein [Spirochaetia bacterium]
MEKRKVSRVPFQVKAYILEEHEEIEVEVENLSLKGILLKSEKSWPANTELSLKICLTEAQDEENTIRLNGKVKRYDNNNAAIIFNEIDIDSFSLLRQVVSVNDGDPEKILKEFLDIS